MLKTQNNEGMNENEKKDSSFSWYVRSCEFCSCVLVIVVEDENFGSNDASDERMLNTQMG